jgi:hypothetical protein
MCTTLFSVLHMMSMAKVVGWLGMVAVPWFDWNRLVISSSPCPAGKKCLLILGIQKNKLSIY